MAVNPYTLNHLYQNGILDYVPTDLMMGTPVGSVLTPMSNPYMNMAQQGALYQNHGTATDSFHSSYTPAYTPNDYQSVSSSANSYVGLNHSNGYNNGMYQTGVQTNFSNPFYGYNGSINRTGIENAGNIGERPVDSNKIDAYNDLSNLSNNINSGVNKISNTISNTPKLILGVIAGTIGLIGIASLFKRGKKPPKTSTNNTSFWSKLNPVNWFKKK
jgi:hypothetical protein